MTHKTDLVVFFLKKGRKSAIPAKELARMMGYSDTRQLRHEIERERRSGFVILSSQRKGGGYYLPGDMAEIDEYIATQTKRAVTTFALMRSALRFRKLMQPGQLYMAEMKNTEDSDGRM